DSAEVGDGAEGLSCEGRRRGRRLEDRRSAGDVIPAGRRRNDQERSVASDAPDREPVETHSITHSTGRDEEKAPQPKWLQSLIFTQSGRRDLNPRPPEPHSGALPDCATSRNARRPDVETSRRPGKAKTPAEHRLPPTYRSFPLAVSTSSRLPVSSSLRDLGQDSAACTGRAVPDRLFT